MIETRGLRKVFSVRTPTKGVFGFVRALLPGHTREVVAVHSVDLRIETGEMVGVLGPNGAGKSTTVKMLTGILVPDAGEATVLGLTPWRRRREVAQRIGVVFGQRTQLWWDLPLRDSLELLRHVYGVGASRFSQNLRRARDLLDLDPFLDTPVRQLSLGQRMRGDLAGALLHDPEVLFLDEPTIGLDVVAKAKMRDALRSLNAERGVTVLLTTHDMADVERLCRRVLLIDSGRVVFDGRLDAIRAEFGRACTLIVDLADDGFALSGVPLEIAEAVEVRSEGLRRWLTFDRSRISASDLIAAVAARYRLSDLTLQEPDIENIISSLYQVGDRTATPDLTTPTEVP